MNALAIFQRNMYCSNVINKLKRNILNAIVFMALSYAPTYILLRYIKVLRYGYDIEVYLEKLLN